MIKKIGDLIEKILTKLFGPKKKKITSYDVFLQNIRDTLDLNVDFRAEYNTENVKVIINPLKPIKCPKSPKKEVKEEEEGKERKENEKQDC